MKHEFQVLLILTETEPSPQPPLKGLIYPATFDTPPLFVLM